MKKYVKDLNHYYKQNNAFWLKDYEHEGFQWIEADDSQQSVISFTRSGKNQNDLHVILCNFTPVPRENYKIGVPINGNYKEVFNSDKKDYGGSGIKNENLIKSTKEEYHGFKQSIEITIPPLSGIYIKKCD